VNARDPVDAIADLTGGGAHVSLDALGSAATCANSIRCLRKRGRHVQVGLMLEDDRSAPIPIHDRARRRGCRASRGRPSPARSRSSSSD
jgi:threonine dehydrogenase-like Zn-dependent dehydrogenase